MHYLKKNNFQHHPYHMVSPSPWPFFTTMSLFTLVKTGVLNLHGFEGIGFLFFIALFNLIVCMSLWFRDIISESV
jgi:cytochrome c oxidase subunit 3